MRVFYSLEEIRNAINKPVVTIGSYDGVHAGHRSILSELKHIAKEENGESLVITFNPHPRTVVNNSGDRVSFLNSLSEKIYLLDSVGIDNLFVINFTPEFAVLSSDDFVRNYIFDAIGAKALIIGYNHQFGHNREGDIDFLNSLRKEYDFRLYQMPKIEVGDAKVSSTVIRGLIKKGDLIKANRYLSAPYLTISKVDLCGNLLLDEPNKLLPTTGSYAVTIKSDNTTHNGKITIVDNCAKLCCDVKFAEDKPLIIQFI